MPPFTLRWYILKQKSREKEQAFQQRLAQLLSLYEAGMTDCSRSLALMSQGIVCVIKTKVKRKRAKTAWIKHPSRIQSPHKTLTLAISFIRIITTVVFPIADVGLAHTPPVVTAKCVCHTEVIIMIYEQLFSLLPAKDLPTHTALLHKDVCRKKVNLFLCTVKWPKYLICHHPM